MEDGEEILLIWDWTVISANTSRDPDTSSESFDDEVTLGNFVNDFFNPLSPKGFPIDE